MDGSNCFSKKIIEWIAQTAHYRKATRIKQMNDQSLLFSINEITHNLKKWTAGSGVLKKIYFLKKNVMLQIDLLKSSCSQKQQYPERALRLKVVRKSSSLEKVAVLKVTLASAIVYNCSSKIFTMLYK